MLGGDEPVADILYVCLGGAFLGACVLYLLACERL